VCNQVARPAMETGAGNVAVTASVGVVSTFSGGQPPVDHQSLLYAADAALYAAKAKGRNRVETTGIHQPVQP
jgi:PleD family two-component response regulator